MSRKFSRSKQIKAYLASQYLPFEILKTDIGSSVNKRFQYLLFQRLLIGLNFILKQKPFSKP